MKKYQEHFNKLNFNEVKELWKKNEYPVNLYIHSPFCMSICRYCFYKGRQYNKEEANKYYYKYLPKLIKGYKEVIEANEINSLFLGGGTPSLMESRQLETMLKALPEKAFEGEKTIEIHPAFWTPSQLDILKEYKFDNIIIGVQTMDEETLVRQNRVVHSKTQLEGLIKGCRKRGFNVLFDVIGFLNNWIEDAIILRNDLKYLYQFKPEQISVQTAYMGKETFDDRLVKEVMASDFDKYNEYSLELEPDNYEHLIDLFSYSKCLRLFKKKKLEDYKKNQFFRFIYGMDENWVSTFEFPVSTLGIGSYRNSMKDTFSNITGDIHYIETNYEWEPVFYGVKTLSFFEEARKVLDLIEERYGEPPKGIEFKIKNVATFDRAEGFDELPGHLEFEYSYDKEDLDKVKFVTEGLNDIMKKRLDNYINKKYNSKRGNF